MIRNAAILIIIAVAALGFFFRQSSSTSNKNAPAFASGLRDYPLPKKLEFAGERVPENDYTKEMLDREFTISVWDRTQVFMWLKRKGRYFPYIEKELKKAGLPEDLKYIPVVESALIPNIHSSAGALGLWQFLKSTGRTYGLQVKREVDERRHFELATASAIKYLKFLHNKFGSWVLAAAAYNCGENKVERLIRLQETENYFEMNLPLETERYIFRLLSAKAILENPDDYDFVLPRHREYDPIERRSHWVNFRQKIKLVDVANYLGLSPKDFSRYNPQFVTSHIPKGRHYISGPSSFDLADIEGLTGDKSRGISGE